MLQLKKTLRDKSSIIQWNIVILGLLLLYTLGIKKIITPNK